MVTVAEALALGTRHHQSGQLAEAEHIYRQVLNADPGNPDAHVNLGLAYFHGKQPADATNQFFQALKLNPESARAHYELATVLVQTKNPAEAADHARRSGELAAKNGDTALAEKSAELLKSLESAPAAGR